MSKPPPGHDAICRDSFEKLTHGAHLTVTLPGPEGGWATSRVGSWKFATFIPAASGFREAVEGVVGPVEWTGQPEAAPVHLRPERVGERWETMMSWASSGPSSAPREKAEVRLTSMCLEIAGFDHEDCPGEWCDCICHKERPS